LISIRLTVLERIDELLIVDQRVNIGEETFGADKELSAGDARIDGRCIRVDGVGSNRFIATVDVESGKRGLERLLEMRAQWETSVRFPVAAKRT